MAQSPTRRCQLRPCRRSRPHRRASAWLPLRAGTQRGRRPRSDAGSSSPGRLSRSRRARACRRRCLRSMRRPCAAPRPAVPPSRPVRTSSPTARVESRRSCLAAARPRTWCRRTSTPREWAPSRPPPPRGCAACRRTSAGSSSHQNTTRRRARRCASARNWHLPSARLLSTPSPAVLRCPFSLLLFSSSLCFLSALPSLCTSQSKHYPVEAPPCPARRVLS